MKRVEKRFRDVLNWHKKGSITMKIALDGKRVFLRFITTKDEEMRLED